MRETPRLQTDLLIATALCVLASFVAPPYPDLALMQNVPTLAGIALAHREIRRTPLPTGAVACVCAFLLLHTVGGRYAYSYVPYEDWLSAIGLPTIRSLTGDGRNGYDRLVHLSFGLLAVHPARSWLRARGTPSRLSTYVSVEFVFAVSCLYEIFEWILTLVMAGPDADLYNGQQGDPWDAQKDMACACVGAIASAALQSFTRLRRRT